MAAQTATRKPYSTDLSDAEWQSIEPLIPKPSTNRGRKRKHPIREILNAIFYLLRAGCAWRMLPHDFPPWKTVYHYFRLWRKDGVWKHINAALRTELREADGREPGPSAAILDSQSVKTTDVKGVRGYDAGKRINGRKRHIAVDTVGNLLEVVVHAAGIQDYHGAKPLLHKLTETVSSLEKLWADGIYKNGGLVDWVRETLDIVLEIVERDPDQVGFKVLPRRWVVERTFAWLGRYRRLSKDYEKCTQSSEGVIYIASIHTMLKRIAPAS